MDKELLCSKFLRSKGIEPDKMKDGRYFWDPPWANGRKDAVHSSLSAFECRETFIKEFGFAVLNEEAIKEIKKYSPILEIGAGSGYWAYELSLRGVDIVATDPEIYYKWEKKHSVLHKLTAEQAMKKFPNRNLLTVWPSYSENWAARALENFEKDYVIYVGEGSGGCTADDKFHQILEKRFKHIKTISIPVFSGLHDRLEVFEKIYEQTNDSK